MSQSAFNRYEQETVERYARSLLTCLNRGMLVDEAVAEDRCKKAVQRFRAHRFLDTNPREVDGRIERYRSAA